MWTQAWRRLNKKGKDEGIARKKTRRMVKVQRAIVGASLEELAKKKQVSKPKAKVSAADAAAAKEVKDRAKLAAKKNKAANQGAPAQKVITKGPKNTGR